MIDPKALAHALGGEARGNHVVAPGPGHSRKDRSLSVMVDSTAPDGFVVNSFAGDDFREARDYVKGRAGFGDGSFVPTPREHHQPVESWRPIVPVPEDAPELTPEMIERGCPVGYRPSGAWQYVDASGALHFLVARFDAEGGGKEIRPFALCEGPGGRSEWRNKAVPENRILYGLPALAARPAAPVLVVEGERTADRAAQQLADYVVVTSAGGSQAAARSDWSPLAGRSVTIWPDNDEAGAAYAQAVADLAADAGAASVRIVALPAGLPPKWDLADPIPAGMPWAHIEAALKGAKPAPKDSPLPLFPPLAAPELYPMDALGPLAEAARAIARKVQVPDAIAAQSVLAAASLAVQAHCDVRLPFGQVRPLSCDFVTVAASGDRKTSADNEALWPVYRHESNLRETHIAAMEQYRIDHTAWSAEKRHIETNKKLAHADRKHALSMLGAEPERPLAPFIVTGDLTPDGLTKNWPWAHAALGVFTAEGGVFTGSHGMSEDNRLRTAAMLSELWDGKPVKRIRAGDGVSILPGRRLALHVMVQPHAAATFLADPVLRDQGLLSRVLVAAPASIAGTRLYRETAPEDDAAIRSYGARILTILEKRPPLADGTRNELTPATLEISAEAATRWRQFFNHVEQALRGDDEFRGIQDFAAKAAEHAARIAGVLTAYANLDAEEIGPEAMDCAIGLMDFYVGEALRLHAAGRTNPDLLMAQRLLDWMRADGAEREPMAFRYILQHGPGPIRTKETLERIVSILMKHGWVRETSSRPRMLIAVGEA
ncbi:YfjI family protein [Xanthobacter autotrophicus]|uniref:YfjI family protein n=1 Tax=Xanthobacter autotrophicus TaxID=280 RepID=UPI0024A730C7|nr:YfjI family protein [Xanthobacter autotrophicus]MDI4655529.1 DUF3987 domain-containing protein [Xanthobacter autotrophicus]